MKVGLEYAGSEGRRIAFRRLPGQSSERTIVYLQTGTIPFESVDDDPTGCRVLEALAELGDVIVFDRRGLGMSDPMPRDTTVQAAWAEDLVEVIETVGAPVVVFAQQFMDFVLDVLGVRPDLLESVIWYEPTTDWLQPEEPDEIYELVAASVRGERDFLSVVCPTRSSDRLFRSWFDGAGARGASPSVAAQLYARADTERADSLRKIALDLEVPLLIIRRPESLVGGRTAVPDDSVFTNAAVINVPGRDWHMHGEKSEAVLNAAASFVLGVDSTSLFHPDRALAALLFTDIVGSTQVAARIGDAEWKELISRHDTIVAAEVGSAGGLMVKSTGDGALCVLPSADSAIAAYRRIKKLLSDDFLEIRAGIHVGDIDRRADDISGLAVTACARIMDRADAGQLLVSSSVVVSVLGSQHLFETVETVELKGLPGTWTLYRSIDPHQRPGGDAESLGTRRH